MVNTLRLITKIRFLPQTQCWSEHKTLEVNMHTATLYRGEKEIFQILLFCPLINLHDCSSVQTLLIVIVYCIKHEQECCIYYVNPKQQLYIEAKVYVNIIKLKFTPATFSFVFPLWIVNELSYFKHHLHYHDHIKPTSSTSFVLFDAIFKLEITWASPWRH